MKVKEFIEQLQRLDQDRNIWSLRDNSGYIVNSPKIEIEEDGFVEMIERGNKVKKGDYLLI